MIFDLYFCPSCYSVFATFKTFTCIRDINLTTKKKQKLHGAPLPLLYFQMQDRKKDL